MSALSPPAPALGARWTDLPNSLDSIYPSCCLSYKQSAGLSPLCFHGLTNCFSRKPFDLITICVAPGGVPSYSVISVLRPPCPLRCAFSCSCAVVRFQQLADSFALLALFFELVPFIFRHLHPFLKKTGGWVGVS